MSKATKAGKYDHVTPALVKQVADVLAEAEGHKYSVSRVFAAYNAVMQKRDKPQTCSSCLRNRVRDLKRWAAEYEKATAPKAGKVVSMPMGTNIGGPGPEDDTDATGQDEDEVTGEGDTAPAGTDTTGQDETASASTEDAAPDTVGSTDTTGQDEAVTGQDEAPAVEDKPATTEPQYVDASAPGYVAQADGTVRYPMADGLPFDFLPNEDTIVKGLVKRADGTGIKTGTYATAEGLEIVVAPGGKATIKEVDLT